jgi:hypothetical protein
MQADPLAVSTTSSGEDSYHPSAMRRARAAQNISRSTQNRVGSSATKEATSHIQKRSHRKRIFFQVSML